MAVYIGLIYEYKKLWHSVCMSMRICVRARVCVCVHMSVRVCVCFVEGVHYLNELMCYVCACV